MDQLSGLLMFPLPKLECSNSFDQNHHYTSDYRHILQPAYHSKALKYGKKYEFSIIGHIVWILGCNGNRGT